ncbi:hypothetical protein SNE40_010611 [Patella caerulea]|uniref:Uncharacterized protein n=1 Tax=Patella caerulea TaxID=87958 RepID=A0AAN8JYL7_PATCE
MLEWKRFLRCAVSGEINKGCCRHNICNLITGVRLSVTKMEDISVMLQGKRLKMENTCYATGEKYHEFQESICIDLSGL